MPLSAGSPGPVSQGLWCSSPKNFSDQLEAGTIWGFPFKSPLAFLSGTLWIHLDSGAGSSPRGSLVLIHCGLDSKAFANVGKGVKMLNTFQHWL